MDATLKLLAAGALFSIGLAAAAVIVPRLGAADAKAERAQAEIDAPAGGGGTSPSTTPAPRASR